ncbi:hypothetical protein niasHT_030812 [Heterodera trifolii]|uniref:C3H1-type domain-containing protein n=1 Tax=Heterodera trifolii TaxID=157864 RepID=A0ABD2HQU9_9BILA
MSCSPSSAKPEGTPTRQHAPLRRVLPKGAAEASISVAQHRADHPLLFASASLQPAGGHGTCCSPPSVVQQRISLPIQTKITSPQQQQQQHQSASATTVGNASASSLADSCYSSCSEGEQQHLLLSRETSSDCGSSSAVGIGTLADAVGEAPPAIDSQLLEFATRLGYTENDLRTVLRHLGNGKEQQQDLVLSELIKLDRDQRRQSLPSSSAGQTQRATTAQPQQLKNTTTAQLRPIVVDGSNIAMNHGNKTVFSCGGIRECVQFFVRRGHADILVFVPNFRREQPRPDSPIVDQHILLELEAERRLVWTPSRRTGGRRIVCHDDRYILKTAAEKQAVIVSNDEYRDLVRENPRWRAVVENLLLMYSFVDGKFMPPDDPLGRRGPKLDQFLTFAHTPLNAQLCPYAKKCTYGNKCKYFHPERVNGVWISATERLASRIANGIGIENSKQLLAARPSMIAEHSQRQNASSSSSSLLPTTARHNNVGRTRSLNCGGGATVAPPLLGGLASPTTAQMEDEQRSKQREENQQTSITHDQQQLLLSPPFPCHGHLPLFRFESSPAGAVAVPPNFTSTAAVALSIPATTQPPQQQQHNSSSSSHSPLSRILSAPAQQQQKPKQYMYSPSSAVWGNCEFSLSGAAVAQSFCPPATGTSANAEFSPGDAAEQQRQRLQYHLCQLFPEATVLAVMGAHPKETDAQRLCQRIIAFQKGFADENDGGGTEEKRGKE